MLKIHEASSAGGQIEPVFLSVEAGVLRVVIGDEALPLPDGALTAVMARYGAPFDPEAEVTEIAVLDLAPGKLRHLRHLAGYDVIARDYIVHEVPDREALCALATTVSAALVHLARAAASG